MCPRDSQTETVDHKNDRGANQSQPAGSGCSGEQHARSSRLARRLIVLTIFFIAPLVLLTIVVQDMLAEHIYVRNMGEIGRQVADYLEQNNRLPDREAFLRFELKDKKMSLSDVNYDTRQILNESPPNTLLAYSSTPKLRFLPRGYAVLYLNGEVEWVPHDTLQDKLKKREQFYKTATGGTK